MTGRAYIGVVPALLIVNQALEVKSVADLIAMAKAKPGALNFASPGAGTSLHLAAEFFASMVNVKPLGVAWGFSLIGGPQARVK